MMTEHGHLDIEIHELNTRMALVEGDLKRIANMSRWVITGVLAIIIQAGGVIYTYAQLTEKVNQMTSSTLPTNVTSNRRVLADHSGEIQGIRTEQARVRERLDILSDRENPVTEIHINKLEARLVRLETKIYQ